ncbi:LPS export ABC transporter permease LptF [Chelatococcus sp. SYSU_G07232]|uniref:LPS export ABC transporter permease LptF n=1 Tax=Chelatococcus albus TaxID=3047466 RepID=A0ABT7ALJ2_9HYPH|nr:LPS export ABC transporter permease LptF [Chelatococcus sp. SYSU_G07232]MDJ1159684.1 LPS export ABC transporter permease LptF [Chelatococcus sp. SYSU_G07232]
MGLIERYILRNAAVAFVACLAALTLVIWITTILRELDLLTGKGQTLGMFLLVTALSLPALVTIIAPVALFIATVYALNKLNGDSELIVMSAAGVPPARLLRPFVVLTAVAAILVGTMTIYLMPASFQGLRDLVTKIRADFVANIVKEGQFTTLDTGITFHYRERAGNALLGIFMQDRREQDKTIVYIAERGQTTEVDGNSYLVLEKGSVQRQVPNSRDSSIVVFDRYAIDLSAFSQDSGIIVYKPRERSTWALLAPDPNEPYYQSQEGRFRAELHDRFSAPLYTVAFMLIAFAALGEARTTRQGRGTAIAAAVAAVVGVRVLGFAGSSALVKSPPAVLLVYGAPLGAALASLFVIFQGPRVKALVGRVSRWLAMRVGPLLPMPRGA